MEAKKKCIFCLQATSEYIIIEETYAAILDSLLININIAKSKQSALCNECSEKLLESFAFKSICLHTEEFITNFINDEGSAIVEAALAFIRKNKNQENVSLDDKKICRLCMRLIENMLFTTLTDIDVPDLKLFHQYIPEMNLKAVREPVICEICFVCLKEYFTFANHCLSVCNKKKRDHDSGARRISPNKNGNTTKCRRRKIIDNVTVNFSGKDVMYECQKCDFKSPHKRVVKSHLLRHEDKANINVYKCDYCGFKTRYKQWITSHTQNHEEYSFNLKKHKCHLCNYRTKRLTCLKNHILSHETSLKSALYKCDRCSFQTKYKPSLQYHAVIHKDVPPLKCTLCPYQTKHKRTMDAHRLTHKRDKTHTCDECGFQTSQKGYLLRHLRTHMEKKLNKTYRCDICQYETKLIKSLKDHQKIHQEPSQMFKCEFCTFETRYKTSSDRHTQNCHSGAPQIRMHKCELCPYETKYK